MLLLLLKNVLLWAEFALQLNLIYKSSIRIDSWGERLHPTKRTFVFILSCGLSGTIQTHQYFAFLVVAKHTIHCKFITNIARCVLFSKLKPLGSLFDLFHLNLFVDVGNRGWNYHLRNKSNIVYGFDILPFIVIHLIRINITTIRHLQIFLVLCVHWCSLYL